MLGLGRPSLLKSRPSLIDLIAPKNQTYSRPSTTIAASLEDPPALQRNVLPSSNQLHHNYNHHRLNPSNETPAPLPSPNPDIPQSPPPTMPPKSSKNPRPGADEGKHGSIYSVSGPVVVAENMIGCAMYELVSIHYIFIYIYYILSPKNPTT